MARVTALKELVPLENVYEKEDELNQEYTLDTVFANLNSCGRFQLIFVPLGYFPVLIGSWGIVFMAFGGYNPGWTCKDDTVNNVSFLSSKVNGTKYHDIEYVSMNLSSISSCQTMEECKNLVFDDSVSTIVTEWNLVCSRGWIVPMITAIQMTGVALGSIVGGQVGAKFGRKFSIHIGAAVMAVTNIGAIFSVSWQMYTVFRFLIGFCSGGILSTTVVYVCEFISAKWRGFVTSFILWSICTMVLSLCVMALKDWRHVHAVTGILAVLTLLTIFWLPESLRLLTIQGKLHRARKVVEKIAKLNKRPIPDFSVMEAVARRELDLMKNNSTYNYCHLFSRSFIKFSLILGLTWFNLSVSVYMIGFGLNSLTGDFFLNFFLYTVLPIPARFISFFLTVRFGCRASCASLVFMSSVSSMLVVLVQFLVSPDKRDFLTLVFALGTHVMSEAAWGASILLVVDLFPTGLRNLSYGFVNTTARVGGILSPFLFSKENIPVFGSFLLVGALQLICFLSLLSLPDTKDRPLQDNLIRGAKRSKEEDSELRRV